MLQPDQSCLVVVDVQGKLAGLMHDKEMLFENVKILIKAAGILEIPIIWCQQYPKGLGATIDEVAELLEGNEPIDKVSFGCGGDEKFCERLESLGKKNVIVCGMETHVCVYQTVRYLLDEKYHVELIADGRYGL